LGRGKLVPDWTTLTWADAMQRGYEALQSAGSTYEEIDAQGGRSNVDIEKHLRRAEIKTAEAQAWFAMARELGSRQERFSGP
jgi:hypothetical protein